MRGQLQCCREGEVKTSVMKSIMRRKVNVLQKFGRSDTNAQS